ncbi:MAG: hypothetical protein SGILL_007709 [Bacillariaceae sp.]
MAQAKIAATQQPTINATDDNPPAAARNSNNVGPPQAAPDDNQTSRPPGNLKAPPPAVPTAANPSVATSTQPGPVVQGPPVQGPPPPPPPSPPSEEEEEVGYGPVGQAIRENPELAKNITEEQHAQILSTADDLIEKTKKDQELCVNKANQDNARAETRRAEQD